METFLVALEILFYLPSMLLVLLLESTFPNADSEVIAIVAVCAQWAAYITLLVVWVRAFWTKRRKS